MSLTPYTFNKNVNLGSQKNKKSIEKYSEEVLKKDIKNSYNVTDGFEQYFIRFCCSSFNFVPVLFLSDLQKLNELQFRFQ